MAATVMKYGKSEDEIDRYFDRPLGEVRKALGEPEDEGCDEDPHGSPVPEVDRHESYPPASCGYLGNEGRELDGEHRSGKPAGESRDEDAGELVTSRS